MDHLAPACKYINYTSIRRTLVILLALGCFIIFRAPKVTRAQSPPIFINEFLVANATFLDTYNYNYSSWIEIYNAGNQAVDLSGFYLTDNLSWKGKWKIPSGTVIGPQGFLLFWADTDNEVNHTNFELSLGGEAIGLSDPSKVLIDSVTFGPQILGVSYGREPDGGPGWFYFSEPTPNAANFGGVPDQTFVPAPQFSPSGSFYADPQSVELTTASPTADIRYTLDGSIPNGTSTLYTSPIVVTSTTVIRARTFETGYLSSPDAVHTYFINDSSSLAVMSIATDPANLWDDEFGIYVEGANYDPNDPFSANYYEYWWRRPIALEFYEPDGTLGFSLDMDMKISGGQNRRYPRKTLQIRAEDKYGVSAIDYQIFNDKPATYFKTLDVRNSGQDWDDTIFHDAMAQNLVKDIDIDIQGYRPVVVFLNGEYWGIHNIRDTLNEYYLTSNYGIDPNNVDLLESDSTVTAGSSQHYDNMINFIELNDMSLPANYDYVKTQMEVGEFADYEIAEIYYSNTDWPGNNLKKWRPRTSDGRWRWIMKDTDHSFGIYETVPSYDMLAYATATAPYGLNQNPSWSTLLVRKLLENDEFRTDFIQRFASHLNITFQSDKVIGTIDTIKANLEPEMPKHIAKWQKPSSIAEWEGKIEVMRDFARQRVAFVFDHINNKFGLNGTVDLTVNISEAGGGQVLINSVVMPGDSFTGPYFKDVPLKLKAVPNISYEFIGWQGISASESITVTLTETTTITALFQSSPIVINEIHYHPGPAQSSDDEFIELYNRGPGEINLEGYVFTSGITFAFPPNSAIGVGQYIVIAKNAAAYSGQGYQVFQWSSGDLSDDGEAIQLEDGLGQVMDYVEYDDNSNPSWPPEPDGNGPSLVLIDPMLNNALPASWQPSYRIGGTPGHPNINMAPLAKDDTANTLLNTALTITVLNNDTDPNGDDLTVLTVATPPNGTATIEDNDTIVYTPTLGFLGTDVFAYTATDSQLSDTANITVVVTDTINAIYLPIIIMEN